ncbi:MAG TPA: SRPBCC family protein [Candidatus Angelobacter sp.]|nr:SRPBCC family protein [Candidatus Angelobacter sp.]
MLILVTAAAIVVVFVVIVATRPADFSVTRSKTISAPATVVFAQVNDFHNWNAWSPWAKMDLTMKTTYEGPSAGTSASYSWAGNSKVGAGRMTIVESRPSELIRIRLEFLKPFPATNQTEFTFKSQDSQTEPPGQCVVKEFSLPRP